MTPTLRAFFLKDPDVVPLVRLFHVDFGTAQYWLNEGETPISAGGQVWEPSYGWIDADGLQLSGDPFDANPAYYTVWNIGNREGSTLAYQALNDPEVWSNRIIRQLWAVRGFPDDAVVVHVGRIMDVRPHESNAQMSIRIRAESVAAARNYTPLGEYTPRDQARRWPGIVDKGLDYVASIPGKKIKGWLK